MDEISESAIIDESLEGGARVVVTSAGRIHWTRPGHVPVVFPLDEDVAPSGALRWSVSESGDSMLMAPLRSDGLTHVSAGSGRVARLGLGERLTEAWQLEIRQLTHTDFFVLLENGFLRVDGTGRERWRISRMAFDWRFVDMHDGAVWLADLHGNLLGFDIESGYERD